jgi:nucleoside-diphosphate kinase
MSVRDARFSFNADYYDPQAGMVRKYQLLYYTTDQTIEMYDIKNKRVFLKRCAYPALNVKELYVGSSVTIFSRSLKLVEYGDEGTLRHFAANSGDFVLLIHGDGLVNAGNIIAQATQLEIRIANIRLVELPPVMANELQVSQRCLVIRATSAEAVKKAEAITSQFPRSVRKFLEPQDCNLINEVAFSKNTTAKMKNCSVCVIKPHAIGSGHGGPILQRILDEGFDVTALGMFSLTAADCEDFFEVYNGVVPEYKKLVEHCSSAAVWAIEVQAENAVSALRAVAGPHDPEICHVLFPHTIRSKFGSDRVRNAVHCTDLAEDGPLESEFFFSLLLNKP